MSQTKPLLEPGARGEDVRGAGAHVDAGCDGGDDARCADGIGGHVGGVAGEQRDRDVQLRIDGALADRDGDPADREADRQPADGIEDEG
jgi:hypothetical protein